MTQPPGADDDAPAWLADFTRRLVLLELQIGKMWELFTAAAHLDTSVDGLRDDVKFVASQWQQIQSNDETLRLTREEVAAVRNEKVSRATLRWTWLAAAVVGGLLVAGMGFVGWGVWDVQAVAGRQCVERQASLKATIAREVDLAATDVVSARPAHRRSAAAYQALVHDC